MIDLINLHKRFGKLQVLQGINLEFRERGKISAILGPNGSGKTTLIKSILGMVLPEEGEIRVDGRPVKGQSAYRSQIGYLPQIAQFPNNLTVKEVIHLIRDIRGPGANEQPFIGLFGLQPYLDKRLNALSGGTKQKVNLTLALMYDSPILILDEPTAGLDPIALIRLKDFLRQEKQKGKLLLITTHIISLVEELADEIVFLLEGKIYFRGAPETLKNQYKEKDLEHAIAGILTHQQKNDHNEQGPPEITPFKSKILHPAFSCK
ncbi:MAG: ABC transporter ATP-binding protein [Haliscomenobacter sp.]|nr:ABC transporter ATP-binding protein [Haliscomenobacter sp.]